MRLEHLLSGENDYSKLSNEVCDFNPCFFTADVYNIEKDEAERMESDSLKPVL